MIQVAQFHLIRILFERENLSQREIARKLGVSRNTVSKYLRQNTPPTAAHRRIAGFAMSMDFKARNRTFEKWWLHGKQ